MRLKVSHAAKEDLESIWLYTVEHWSMEQADRYVNLIADGFDAILNDPKAGRDCGELRKGYRRTKVGSHLIFYRLDDADQEIEIVRVLHEQMDIEGRLGP